MSRKGLYTGNFILDANKHLADFPKPTDKPVIFSKLKKPLLALLFITSVCACSYIGYNAFKYSKFPESIDQIPLIKADIAPLKMAPQDPGGTKFDNQDKLIYRNLEDPNFKHKDDINKILSDEVVMREKNTLRTPARDIFAAKAKKKKDEADAKKEHKQVAKKEEKKKTSNPFELIED
ncbi:MAG: hypothetical protein ACK5WS_01255 [Alphaproteobacteria bacterium]|jgi:hypothetical protein|nr:hypothetical protein [Candidatus Jidaibacter sp.]